MQDEVRRGRHVVSRIYAHLVFVPKCRGNIFDADALQRLQTVFAKVCGDFEATLDEFNGEPDHVHLLVYYPPKVSISALVNSLKGVSARRLRQDRPDMAGCYWQGRLWSASYFAASCGGAPIDALRQYIEQQRVPQD